MPRAVDRFAWRATDEVTVEATASMPGERLAAERSTLIGAPRASAVAYTARGQAIAQSITAETSYPFISIGPADVDFGTSPEQTRAGAPRANRATVSTFEEEILIYKQRGEAEVRARGDSADSVTSEMTSIEEECSTDPQVICEPDPPPTYRPMGVSIPSGKTYSDCYQPGVFDTSIDRDQDGVDDLCEAELIIAFSPQLKVDEWDCDLGRRTHFAARRKYSGDWGGVIFLFYAISYAQDCGSVFGGAHIGDSEWIILEVGPSANPSHAPWSLKYGTMSAHWGLPSPLDQTAGYPANVLEDADNSPGFGAPIIWVSLNKHANYRSRYACNDSPGDTCNSAINGFLVNYADRNLGSSQIQFVGGASTPIEFNGGSETYWVLGDTFCGWQFMFDRSGCASPYQRSLSAYGF